MHLLAAWTGRRAPKALVARCKHVGAAFGAGPVARAGLPARTAADARRVSSEASHAAAETSKASKATAAHCSAHAATAATGPTEPHARGATVTERHRRWHARARPRGWFRHVAAEALLTRCVHVHLAIWACPVARTYIDARRQRGWLRRLGRVAAEALKPAWEGDGLSA